MKSIITCCLLLNSLAGMCQTFYFGNDLSYVNQMEDCGAVFKEDNMPKDVYQIFADHGTNLVRVRLWHNPSWQNTLIQPGGVKSQYSDFVDVRETIKRSKDAGMMVMLDVHFSDFWADPAHQIIPSDWVSVATDTAALADSVYNYVVRILTSLEHDTLMPEIVKVGNENNGGILRHTTLNADYTAGGSVSTSWVRHAHMYKSAIRAIRNVSMSTEIKPKICLHYAGLNYIENWYQTLINNGVTDFDIIGLSYYYAWHDASIDQMGNTIRNLRTVFPDYEVMIAETAYPWTLAEYDEMENICSVVDPAYLPVSPEKQLEYMVDYTREIMQAGGIGLVFWEPAWVSTPCVTPWGEGSAHDHIAFFAPGTNNFMENGAGRWPESAVYAHPDYRKITFKVNTEGVEIPGKMYITGDMTGETWSIQPMVNEGLDLYNYVIYLPQHDSGAFYFLNDSAWEARENVPAECAFWWGTDRGYKVGTNDTVIGYKWGTCQSATAAEDINVTFKVDMTGADVSNDVWITGSFTGNPWQIIKMTPEDDNIYTYSTIMHPGDSGAYYFMNDNVWGVRETVPSECATWWDSDRGYRIGHSDTTYAFTWGTCLPPGFSNIIANHIAGNLVVSIYPIPSYGESIRIDLKNLTGCVELEIIDLNGTTLFSDIIETPGVDLLETSLGPGTYLLKIKNGQNLYNHKLIILGPHF